MASKKLINWFNQIKQIIYQPENWVSKDLFKFNEVTFKIIKGYGEIITAADIEIEFDKTNNQIHFLKGSEEELETLIWNLYPITTFNCKRLNQNDLVIARVGRHYRKSVVLQSVTGSAVDIGLKSVVHIQHCIKLPAYSEEEEHNFTKLAFYESEGREPDMNNEKDMLAISAIQLGISFAHKNILSLK